MSSPGSILTGIGSPPSTPSILHAAPDESFFNTSRQPSFESPQALLLRRILKHLRQNYTKKDEYMAASFRQELTTKSIEELLEDYDSRNNIRRVEYEIARAESERYAKAERIAEDLPKIFSILIMNGESVGAIDHFLDEQITDQRLPLDLATLKRNKRLRNPSRFQAAQGKFPPIIKPGENKRMHETTVLPFKTQIEKKDRLAVHGNAFKIVIDSEYDGLHTSSNRGSTLHQVSTPR